MAYHHGNLRTALLDAGLGLIRAGGVGGLSLRKVAEQAGVSRAAPYHHFKDKEALLAALCKQGYEGLSRALLQHLEGVNDPWERLRVIGRVYLRYALDNPEVYRLMWSSEIDKECFPDLQVCAFGIFEVLTGVLEGCSTEGGANIDDLPATALHVWASVHGLASLMIDGVLQRPIKRGGGEEIPIDVIIEREIAFVIAAIRP